MIAMLPMVRKHKQAVLGICLVLLSLVLGLGCQLPVRLRTTLVATPASTAQTSVTTVPTATTQLQEATPTLTPAEAPTGAPVDIAVPGELRLYSPAAPETLDPAIVQDATSHRFVSLIFSGLVTLNSKLEVVPDLAERWDVDPSGTVYTFYLNKGAKFHNGQPVTARDIVYSIDRACDPKRGSVLRAQSYLDDIVGAKSRTTGEATSISGLKAVDDSTVEITIDAPKPYFLAKLTYPTSYVVNQEEVEQAPADWASQPIGTGPFKVEENGADGMVLAAFGEYYRGRPQLDRVTFTYRGQSMNQYERGQLDVVEVGGDYIDRVLDPNEPLHSELRIVPQLDVWYIGFNCTKPPFDDMHVRRAFAFATNKKAIAEIAMNKMVVPATGILPPGMPGYNANLKGLDYDPTTAVDEITQSAYGDVSELPPIVLTVTEAGSGDMLKEMYQQALGVEIQVEVVTWTEFLAGLDTRQYQMFSLGWIGDYPDPQNFLDLLFHSVSVYNHQGYSSPEVDALLEKARVERDTNTRLGLYQEVESRLVQDAPWVPVYHSGGYYLVKPYVKNLEISAQDTLNLHEVTIER